MGTLQVFCFASAPGDTVDAAPLHLSYSRLSRRTVKADATPLEDSGEGRLHGWMAKVAHSVKGRSVASPTVRRVDGIYRIAHDENAGNRKPRTLSCQGALWQLIASLYQSPYLVSGDVISAEYLYTYTTLIRGVHNNTIEIGR